MRNRHRPVYSARGLPRHRCAGSFVHRGPRSAEAASPDEAGWLLLVADQLRRHHHHQGVPGMSEDEQKDRWRVNLQEGFALTGLSLVSPPGSCGFVSEHHSESGWERRLSVQFLHQQLRPEGQNREGERLHHHRPLPGTRLIHRVMENGFSWRPALIFGSQISAKTSSVGNYSSMEFNHLEEVLFWIANWENFSHILCQNDLISKNNIDVPEIKKCQDTKKIFNKDSE